MGDQDNLFALIIQTAVCCLLFLVGAVSSVVSAFARRVFKLEPVENQEEVAVEIESALEQPAAKRENVE